MSTTNCFPSPSRPHDDAAEPRGRGANANLFKAAVVRHDDDDHHAHTRRHDAGSGGGGHCRWRWQDAER